MILRRISLLSCSCVFQNRLQIKKLSNLTVLSIALNAKDAEVQRGFIRSENAKKIVQELMIKVQQGGGERAIKRHTITNRKILARNRLKMLFDSDSPFMEIGAFAGLDMDYGDIPAAGIVAGIGKIHGYYCTAGTNDATVKGGTFFPITVDKHMRLQRQGFINYLPGIHIVDSGGAFLPLQSEIFPDRDHGGRAFRNEAVASAKGIPQVAIVSGSCTAGGAYGPTMTEEAIIVKGIGTIFLGGPPLVKAATGEIVTEEELGGADLHCKISGCTDYYAESEKEAYEMCRDTILTLNMDKGDARISYSQPLHDSKDLAAISGKSVMTKEDMYLILARTLDGSAFKEFKKLFGENLITGFGFICGQLAGIVANSGHLTYADAQKGAHFIQLCDQRDVPLVFLQNSGDRTNTELVWQEGLALKDRAKMVAAHSCAQVPKITINVGGCYHDDNYTMCGWAFKPNFLFSWPLAHTAFEPSSQRIELMDRLTKECDSEMVFHDSSSAFYLSSRVLQDGIILPEDTRETLALCLDIAVTGQKNRLNHSLRNKRIPVFRM